MFMNCSNRLLGLETFVMSNTEDIPVLKRSRAKMCAQEM